MACGETGSPTTVGHLLRQAHGDQSAWQSAARDPDLPIDHGTVRPEPIEQIQLCAVVILQVVDVGARQQRRQPKSPGFFEVRKNFRIEISQVGDPQRAGDRHVVLQWRLGVAVASLLDADGIGRHRAPRS